MSPPKILELGLWFGRGHPMVAATGDAIGSRPQVQALPRSAADQDGSPVAVAWSSSDSCRDGGRGPTLGQMGANPALSDEAVLHTPRPWSPRW